MQKVKHVTNSVEKQRFCLITVPKRGKDPNLNCDRILLLCICIYLGYKINSSDTFPEDLQSDYSMATETYITTVEWRKKVRVRYLPKNRLDEEVENIVKEHMTSFQHLYFNTVVKLHVKVSKFAKSFLQTVDESCRLYDRYLLYFLGIIRINRSYIPVTANVDLPYKDAN